MGLLPPASTVAAAAADTWALIPGAPRGGIASNTQGERGSSQHILVNPSVENWKTVPE